MRLHSLRHRVIVLALLASLGLAPCAWADAPVARAAGVETGTLQQAPYRIEIPKGWNGELVMLMHGYEPVGAPRDAPWPANPATPLLLEKGYAVAESAYSGQGWAVAEAVPDVERLRAAFVARHGQPSRTYAVGFSLGGQIALATLEQHGAHYDGALSLCGVNAPAAQVFSDAVLLPLVAFERFYPGVMGLAAGGLADPASPAMLDTDALEAALKGDEATATRLVERLQIPRDGLPGALMLYHLVLREATNRAGGFPVDNRTTVYAGFGDDAAFNAAVRRYTGDAKAVAYIARNAALSGRAGKPVVLQSNQHDPTVPARLSVVYQALATTAGQGGQVSVLPAVGEGHCGFSPAQVQGAMEELAERVGR